MDEMLKTPPNNAEAERAVLGSILLDTTSRSEDRVMDLCLTGGIVPDATWEANKKIVTAGANCSI